MAGADFRVAFYFEELRDLCDLPGPGNRKHRRRTLQYEVRDLYPGRSGRGILPDLEMEGSLSDEYRNKLNSYGCGTKEGGLSRTVS